LEPIPDYVPWRYIFKIFLFLRSCIKKIEGYKESTKVVEIRNCLAILDKHLKKLGQIPPPFQNDFPGYLESFSKWILEWAELLAKQNK
jgi:hypothetical protein